MNYNVNYTINDFINMKVDDVCRAGFNEDDSDYIVNSCVRVIGDVIKAKERLSVFGDAEVLLSLTIGELAMILEDYFATPESPEVILRMHHDAKILCKNFVRLFSQSFDMFVDDAGEPYKPHDSSPSNYFLFHLTVKSYFDELQTGSGKYASYVFNALYTYLTEHTEFVGDDTMYEIISEDILVKMIAPFETPEAAESSVCFCFYLLFLPLALYMRYHEQLSTEYLIKKVKEVKPM